MLPTGRRAAHRALVGAAALVLVLVPTAIGAQEPEKDPRREREEVRDQQAAVAAQVDALEAEATEVAQALADLEANVATQEAALADAESQLAQAELESELAAQRVVDTELELSGLEQMLRDVAVAAYVEPPSDRALSALEQGSAEDAETRKALLDLRSGDAADLIDQVKDTKARLEAERDDAVVKERDAAAYHAVVKQKAEELQAAYERQAEFAWQVEERLESKLAESASLEELDAELSAEIARQEAELAAKLKAAQEAAKKAKLTAPKAPAIDIPAPGEIVTVRGIRVHESIASQLDAMLGAAAAEGITLGGGGWRSSESQIALRKAHCGSSHYAIYEAPASSCRPPTARPGHSMHERGLAIDFTCNGASGAISSRSSPCYQWLAANASGYGFYNLPSEPWHWSINGQ
jgi:LAS superfamily LD-carboxypeptidase LdcB